MYSLEKCILGQLYGDYESGLVELFGARSVKYDLGVQHGFEIVDSDDIIHVDPEYRRLEEYWKSEIEKRLKVQ